MTGNYTIWNSVLPCSPLTRKTYLVVVTTIVLTNATILLLHDIGSPLFDQWIQISAGVVAYVSRLLPDAHALSEKMTRLGYMARVVLIENINAVNWLLYLGAIGVVIISTIVEFSWRGATISCLITHKLQSLSRGSSNYRAAIIKYMIMMFVSALSLYVAMEWSRPFEIFSSSGAYIFIIIVIVIYIKFPTILVLLLASKIYSAHFWKSRVPTPKKNLCG
jgi:hypothetical protein